jgi:hypothetical protein
MKSDNKKTYVTLGEGIGGCDFRSLARIMTKFGYKMNHATARNQLILATESLLQQTAIRLKVKLAQEDIREMLESEDIQESIADMLYLAYSKNRQMKQKQQTT